MVGQHQWMNEWEGRWWKVWVNWRNIEGYASFCECTAFSDYGNWLIVSNGS